MQWLEKNFSKEEQKEIELVRFCHSGKYRSRLSTQGLIIAKMTLMLEEIHYSLAPIGGMGDFAEDTKKAISKIMGF